MEESFAFKLSELMKEKEVSVVDLANYVDVSRATVNNWLNGKSLPNKLKFILALSNYLEVSPSYFFNALKNK